MKIAVYGGSFNPPHIGHVNVAKTVVEKIGADKILIIPDYKAPHKKMAEGTPPAQDRLEMCKLAFKDVDGAIVSDIEILRKGKSYTSDTIAILKTQFPDEDFYLVIGTDMLLSFTKWHEFEQILREVTLVVLSREINDDAQIAMSAKELEEKYKAKIIIINNEPIVISSSEIREEIVNGKDSKFLPDEVFEYIKRKSLYLGE